MSVAKSLEGQERKKIGHEEQLELYYYKRVTTKVIQFQSFQFRYQKINFSSDILFVYVDAFLEGLSVPFLEFNI